MNNWYSICALNEGAEISIYDEIGAYGVSAKAFLADLGKLPDKAPLTLRLNSPGGSVFDAVAIYNALQRHAGTVTVSIDGIAASAASYIAMDLSRNCAAPLAAYYAQKENDNGKESYGRI